MSWSSKSFEATKKILATIDKDSLGSIEIKTFNAHNGNKEKTLFF